MSTGNVGSEQPLRIWFVTNTYPSPDVPQFGTFVASLARSWARMGAEVSVAAPRPFWSPTRGALAQEGDFEPEPEGLWVDQPSFWSFSNKTLAPGFSTALLSLWSFTRSVRGCRARLPFAPDLAYGHFLFPAAYAAIQASRGLNVPVVGALGEADLREWESLAGLPRARRTARALDAIVSVSKENADHCVEHYGVDPGRILVAPNGVDLDHFKPSDRRTARARLGLPQDQPIVVFTGHFIERKGPLRLLRALEDHPEVGAVFLGAGPQEPRGSQVLFSGSVPNRDVPVWLSAADVFVLPTQAEGSPNAVLEAMACGLPVISGDVPSLRETVTPEAARLVPPDDVAALSAAIGELFADPDSTGRMANAATEHAKTRSLAMRAATIHGWLRTGVETGRWETRS